MNSKGLKFALLFAASCVIAEASAQRIIHVVVALCDNDCQGIVPVPERIGDGDNPAANLYWGCGYGVSNFFDKKTGDWKLIERQKQGDGTILERCFFKHKSLDIVIVAEAYRGCAIEKATEDFFLSCAGLLGRKLDADGQTYDVGQAELVCYVGHNGLMDFDIEEYPRGESGRKAIMLACISSEYFGEGLRAAGAEPLLWTRGLMAPEAYTLEAALTAYATNQSDAVIEKRAEQAYLKYQGVKESGANWLFKKGW